MMLQDKSNGLHKVENKSDAINSKRGIFSNKKHIHNETNIENGKYSIITQWFDQKYYNKQKI